MLGMNTSENMNELPDSAIDRQNILDNISVVEKVRQALHFTGVLFGGEYRYAKKMVADFYEIDVPIVNRYLAKYGDELECNGYILFEGESLKMSKSQFGGLMDEAAETTVLGLFDFRAVLNLGMLLTESEKARWVRSLVLDIVLDTINSRTGGGTKYINRRDVNDLRVAMTEEKRREKITSAIGACVSGHRTMKYALVSDLIYREVFRGKAKEYREILRSCSKNGDENTLFAEVLSVVSSFEDGVAEAIRRQHANKGHRLLSIDEVRLLIEEIADSPMQKPCIADACSKMASCVLSSGKTCRGNTADFLRAGTPDEFGRFIGDRFAEFDAILEENQDVLKRLKQDGENE